MIEQLMAVYLGRFLITLINLGTMVLFQFWRLCNGIVFFFELAYLCMPTVWIFLARPLILRYHEPI